MFREHAPYTLTAATLMSVQPLVVVTSKNAQGSFDYSVPSSTLFSEVLKFAISSLLLLLGGTPESSTLDRRALREFLAYSLPSLIYFINNNLAFFVLQAVDPTTFQLLSQMKILFTALLFRVFLKKHLTAVQYLALVTLACGTACSQLPAPHKKKGAPLMAAPMLGFCLSTISSFLSALGGIYNEKLLKKRPSHSIHWQNLQMYVWGVLFNAVAYWLKDGRAGRRGGLLEGYSSAAWAVVVCNAFNGLAVSAVLKYADNIARAFAHAIAMIFTMGVSVQLFHAPVTPQLVLACVLVGVSTLQYNLPASMLRAEDEISHVERSGLMGMASGSDASAEGLQTDGSDSSGSLPTYASLPPRGDPL